MNCVTFLKKVIILTQGQNFIQIHYSSRIKTQKCFIQLNNIIAGEFDKFQKHKKFQLNEIL